MNTAVEGGTVSRGVRKVDARGGGDTVRGLKGN